MWLTSKHIQHVQRQDRIGVGLGKDFGEVAQMEIVRERFHMHKVFQLGALFIEQLHHDTTGFALLCARLPIAIFNARQNSALAQRVHVDADKHAFQRYLHQQQARFKRLSADGKKN